MSLARMILVCVGVVLMSVSVIMPAYGEFMNFDDPFDYPAGDLQTQSGGAWVNLTGAFDVVAAPGGSTSGPNLVGPHLTQTFQQVGRALGSAVDGDQYEFRLSVYAGNPAAVGNDDMQMRITNNTSAFNSSSNKNIVFQTGIADGRIMAQQGTTSGVYSSIKLENVTADHWYEFRAVYSTIDGPDTVVIDYRDITAGGAWTELAFFDMDAGIDNELTLSGTNNFAINTRDWTNAGLAADDASVTAVPEPTGLMLCLMGLIGMAVNWRGRS